MSDATNVEDYLAVWGIIITPAPLISSCRVEEAVEKACCHLHLQTQSPSFRIDWR